MYEVFIKISLLCNKVPQKTGRPLSGKAFRSFFLLIRLYFFYPRLGVLSDTALHKPVLFVFLTLQQGKRKILDGLGRLLIRHIRGIDTQIIIAHALPLLPGKITVIIPAVAVGLGDEFVCLLPVNLLTVHLLLDTLLPGSIDEDPH